MSPKDADGMAKSVDPDQTASVWSGVTLFARTCLSEKVIELQHDKTNKMSVHPAKTPIRLGGCPV